VIRGDFLSPRQRSDLKALLRDGHTEQRLARRANAMLLLDDGWSCERVAEALYLDDDTVRGWRKLYDEDGIDGLRRFEAGGGTSHLTRAQEEELATYVSESLPRSTREMAVFLKQRFGVVYESRSGLIALLHRLGFEYKRPRTIGRGMRVDEQQAFIGDYEKLLNSLASDEAIVFADAVHPVYAARAVGCWARPQNKPAIAQTAGRGRLNIHGALDLDTGKTAMIEVETVDAASTIKLLETIEAQISEGGAGPRLLGQCALPPRRSRSAMACANRPTDQAALHPQLLSTSEPDRAAVGRHAQTSHSQPDLA
jgi:transposase